MWLEKRLQMICRSCHSVVKLYIRKERKAGCQDSASVSQLCHGGAHCLFCRGRVGSGRLTEPGMGRGWQSEPEESESSSG